MKGYIRLRKRINILPVIWYSGTTVPYALMKGYKRVRNRINMTCNKTVSKAVRLREQERMHTDGMPYEWLACSISFCLVGGLRDHEMKHTGGVRCRLNARPV